MTREMTGEEKEEEEGEEEAEQKETRDKVTAKSRDPLPELATMAIVLVYLYVFAPMWIKNEICLVRPRKSHLD